ncbi:MAG: acetate/propionate family kinase [Myxococcales bacterium]|nr:acetate/propionate family kinase [Myxococcales bacterium]
MSRASPPAGLVLCVNSGSSSLKVAAFAPGERDERRVAEAAVEGIGQGQGRFHLAGGQAPSEHPTACADHRAALDLVLRGLDDAKVGPPTAVGHRIVHGGERHVAPETIGPELLLDLRELVPLAPLHLPPSIHAIEAVSARLPGVPQVACFDTAFHATLPPVARRLPLPDRFAEVRRFGFHGLSYEYILSTFGSSPPARLVVAHLGNGASLAAVREGRCVDTTMGFTPTGGILMGSRTGDLDPGAIVYLMRRYGLSADAIEHLVERESGLLGIGGTADMKELLARRPSDPRAALAVEMFGYGVRKAIGAFAAALGGLDALVFTGGIGERAPEIRAAACRGLDAFGVVLDEERNARGEDPVGSSAGRCAVRVVATDEDRVIARHARRLLARG